MKRIITMALCIILCISLCSCGMKNNTNNTNQSNKTGSLTLWGSADDQNMLSDMVSAFRKAGEDIAEIGVKVTGEDVAANEALKDVDAAADVYAISHDSLGSLVEAGAIYEITGTRLSNIKESVSSSALSAATYNGKVYGFPSSSETYLMYYDKSIYTEAEVKSLETMLDKKLADGVYNFGMNFSEGYYGSSFFFTAGCTLYGENGDDATKCDFNNDDGVAAAKYIKKLGTMNVINCDESEALSLMKSGKLAAYVTGPWKSENMKDALGTNYGVCALPTVDIKGNGDNRQLKSFSGYKIYVVNSATSDPETAMKLAEHLTNEENQKKRFTTRAMLPVHTKVAALDEVVKDETVAATLDQLNNSVPMPAVSQVSKYWTAFAAFSEDCFNGKIADSDIKSKLDSLVNQAISQTTNNSSSNSSSKSSSQATHNASSNVSSQVSSQAASK